MSKTFDHLLDSSPDDSLVAPTLDDSSPSSLSPALSLPPLVPAALFSAASATATTPQIADYETLEVVSGDVTFNLDFQYLSGHAIPTANFIADVENAATILGAAIKDTMTLNLVVGYGELEGAAITGGGAEGGPVHGVVTTDNYAAVRTALLNNEPGDPDLADLPNATSIDGYSTVTVWNAEAKALGLLSATATGEDGEAGFAIGISDSEMVGVALHELSHAMGRAPAGFTVTTNGVSTLTPDIFDFTRYSSQGNIVVNNVTPSSSNLAPASYFSVDGGKTTLANYGQDSDPSDFANSGVGTPKDNLSANDPFDQYYASSTVQGLTRLDLTQLDVLGFNTSSATATPCYVAGTAIRTARGDVAVERLSVGDVAITASGERRQVQWIGRRSLDLSRHGEPEAVYPVRIAAGAFGADLPLRDLWLSPGHCIAFEGALIPVSRLVNGRSVAQVARASVEYWHVELVAHDVLLAEGLPAESYLDTGNRTGFLNGGAFVETHPDFRPRHWRETCLPIALEGPAVAAARRRLLAELEARGEGVSADDDAHLIVDGRRLDPARSGGRLEFVLPPGAREIVLRSGTFIPAHSLAESEDRRSLGLSVARLEIDGAAIDLAALDGAGWHKAEGEGGFTHRWTDGRAQLPPGGRVVVELAGPGYYWAPVEGAARAA